MQVLLSDDAEKQVAAMLDHHGWTREEMFNNAFSLLRLYVESGAKKRELRVVNQFDQRDHGRIILPVPSKKAGES